MIWLLALALAAGPSTDPRIPVLEQLLAGEVEQAAQSVEAFQLQPNNLVQPVGASYQLGHLLDLTGRADESGAAFRESACNDCPLNRAAQFRVAGLARRSGDISTALAELSALQQSPSEISSFSDAVSREIVMAIESNDDCSLLTNLAPNLTSPTTQRPLQLARVRCALQTDQMGEAESLLLELITDRSDPTSMEAANLLIRSFPDRARDPQTTPRLGMILYHQRDFARALPHLERTLASNAEYSSLSFSRSEVSYAVARSWFWLGDYERAAQQFQLIADTETLPELKARAYFQMGRARELAGRPTLALQSFSSAERIDPSGDWAAPALISLLRLLWISGDELAATDSLARLQSRESWRSLAIRAALFLASSDIETGRTDRAGEWLDEAERSSALAPTPELLYWQARLAETSADPGRAVTLYLAVLSESPHNPFASGARTRLMSSGLVQMTARKVAALTSSNDAEDLRTAWHFFESGDSRGQAANSALIAQLAEDPAVREYLRIETTPPALWPLLQDPRPTPAELLLTLGDWSTGAEAIPPNFPMSDLSLGYTGARLLQLAGLTRKGLYRMEILNQNLPENVPLSVLPPDFRRALYPRPFAQDITEQSDRHNLDPHLLAAVIREESRFDPDAVSQASARGLTQLVLTTAQQIAPKIGLPNIVSADLHRPTVSIAIGAAYLSEVIREFDGRDDAALAAYNAGPAQARLWLSYCVSSNREELLTKVGFPETRSYLQRVISARNRYEDLYSDLAGDQGPPDPAPAVETTGGSTS